MRRGGTEPNVECRYLKNGNNIALVVVPVADDHISPQTEPCCRYRPYIKL